MLGGILVISGVLSLSACAPNTTPVIAVRKDAPDVAAQALIEGVLVVTDGNCVGIERSDGTVLPVLFPAGSTLSAGGSGVLIPGVGELAIGSEISGSGAFSESSALTDATIPDECREGIFAVLEG